MPEQEVHREYHRWHSPSLGRDMELLVFGHAGARMLVFPTSQGRYYEWEDRGMIAALEEHLERGWIQAFCVDSVDAESWYARDKHPGERAWRHVQYERYLLSEVLPLTRSVNPDPFLIAAGASFGAYHAVNLAFRHPDEVNRVVALAGLYDIKQMTGGHSDETVYANDPSHYMMHLSDHDRLEAIRRQDLIFAIGRDDPNRADNEHLSGVLWSKGIWHALRVVDGWAHDWPWWQGMIRQYVGGSD
jgi:esterase/lipase superfamily enzyme